MKKDSLEELKKLIKIEWDTSHKFVNDFFEEVNELKRKKKNDR